jgi:hypothetical protein
MPGSSDIGAFRTVCTFSHMNFDDALIYPGRQGAAHLHTYWGNTASDYRSTPESIRNSGNSTCRGGIANRSSYWAPSLIDTRDGRPLVPNIIHVYYKTGYLGVPNSAVRPWPQGLRMIAGNAASTGGNNPGVWYRCNAGPNSPTIMQCAGELSMHIEFPQCWNGRDLSSPDHKSHMAYARGGCPSSHPIAMAQLTVNIHYDTQGGVNYRLSSDVNGAPAGSSGHADFIEGWIPEVFRTAVERVINPGLTAGSHMLGDGRVMNCGYPGCR